MSNSCKAIFWDFDGTLTVHKPIWTQSVHRALELAAPGCGVAVETVRPHLQSGFTWHTPEEDYRCLCGEGAWWERLRLHFIEVYTALGVEETVAAEAAALVRALVLDLSNFTLYDDALPMLKACAQAGYQNFLLSNNFPELPDVADRLGLSPWLSGCIVSACAGFEKPRREIFEIALEAAGRPGICFMVGDNPVADIAGAQALGIPAILVHNQAPAPADYVCQTLTDVLGVLGL